MLRQTTRLCCCMSVVWMATTTANAALITLPTDLGGALQYRLVFISNGSQSSILTTETAATFNTLVADEAAAVTELSSLGTTWTAIVSTAAVDARNNTSTNPNVSAGVPIYLVGTTNGGGTDPIRIADSYSDLWDGSILAPINRTSSDTPKGGRVWTGTGSDGTASSPLDGAGTARYGSADSNLLDPLHWINQDVQNQSGSLASFYAISGVLTVPEPNSLHLAASLLVTAIACRSTRRLRARLKAR